MKFLFDLFPVIFFFSALKIAEKWHGAAQLLSQILIFLGFNNTVKPDLVPIMLATIAAIAATLLQVAWVKYRHGKVEKMLWLSFSLIVVFGGLTLYFQDANFIKWKPTILYWLMGASLLVSNIFFKKNYIKTMMVEMVEAPETIWNKLNLAWATFFIVLGFLNLYVAFNYSTDTWASYKLFGTTAMMFLFIIAQTMLLKEYLIAPPEDNKDKKS
jgi:intracellular septation protein